MALRFKNNPGLIASSVAGGGGGGSAAPADTTLATRKSTLLADASAEAGTTNSTAYVGGAWATARYIADGQAAGNAALDVVLNARSPLLGGTYKTSDSFEPCWWMMPKLYGNISGTRNGHSRDAILRDIVGAYNTQASLSDPVLASAGRTPNQYWMNQVAAILCWEQWGGQSFGSTASNSNHAGVQSRYNFARDIFWPQYGNHIWRYGLQEIGIGYMGTYLMIAWMLKDKSTTSSVQKIGDFLWNQFALQLSHLWGFDQIALPADRQHQHQIGTPLFPEAVEMILWLMHNSAVKYTTKRQVGTPRHPHAESQYLVPLAASANFTSSAYAVARNIRHTASTHAPFEFKSAERRTLQDENVGRGAASPSYPYIYCTPKYQVGHFVWGGGLNYAQRVNNAANHIYDYRGWSVVVKNTSSSACNSLTVTADNDGNNFTNTNPGGFPATTPYEVFAGLKGTIVSAFFIEDATDPQWFNMAIPPVFTATATSGNWWFGSSANCYVAVYLGRGFTLQAARNWYWNSGNGSVSMPWLRSPGSGSAARNIAAVETADPADHASFAAFQSAVLATRSGATAGIGSATSVDTSRIVYHDLKGNSFDVQYKTSIVVNGSTITTQHHNGTVSSPRHKRLDTPWVQLSYGGDDMLVTDPADGAVTRWRWSDKTITAL